MTKSEILVLADQICSEMHSILSNEWDRQCLKEKIVTALLAVAGTICPDHCEDHQYEYERRQRRDALLSYGHIFADVHRDAEI